MVLVLFQQHGCSSNHYYGFDNGYLSAWKLITFNKDVEQIQSKVPVVPTSRKKPFTKKLCFWNNFMRIKWYMVASFKSKNF